MPNAGRSSRTNRDSQSWTPLLLLIVFLVVLYLLWRILFIFILAAFVAFVLSPLVALFPKKMPRIMAIIAVYLGFTAIVVIVGSILTPVVVQQYSALTDSFPGYVDELRKASIRLQAHFGHLRYPWSTIGDRVLSEFQQFTGYVTREIIPTLLAFVTSLFALVLIPLLAFFMLLGGDGYKRTLMAVIPKSSKESVSDLLICTNQSLWNFVRGEFILMLAVGTVTGVGLYLVGMPYSVVFGIAAGLLEVIPSLGPLTSNILVGTVAILISPVLALKALSVTVGVQLLENAFLVPMVMGKSVGLNPVTVAFAVILGGKTAGVLGAAISIPLAVLVKIVILYFYARPDELPDGKTAICRPGARRGHATRTPEDNDDRSHRRAA